MALFLAVHFPSRRIATADVKTPYFRIYQPEAD
jgi:hypothetical protein